MNEQPLKEDIFNILRILSSGEDHTQRDLSAYLGFSLGKTNYLIKELVKKGLLKAKIFSRRTNKLKRISYFLTPQGMKEKAALTLHFLERKEKEYLQLKKEFEEVMQNQEPVVEANEGVEV